MPVLLLFEAVRSYVAVQGVLQAALASIASTSRCIEVAWQAGSHPQSKGMLCFYQV